MYQYKYFYVKISDANNVFNPTFAEYRKVVKYFVKVIEKEWDNLQTLNGRDQKIESLTVRTRFRPNPKYDIKAECCDIPSYIRRSAGRDAFGIVTSYKELYNQYLEGKQGEPAPLKYNHKNYPTFYLDGRASALRFTSRDTISIRIFNDNRWRWFNFKLREQDVKYKEKIESEYELLSPVLIKKGKSCYLRFSYKIDSPSFKSTGIAIGVDLGLKYSAVLAAINKDGVRTAFKFIQFKSINTKIKQTIEKRKEQQRNGAKKPRKAWGTIVSLNKRLAALTAKEIVKFAIDNNAEAIVFENLSGRQFNAKGLNGELLHLWPKAKIRDLTDNYAHAIGIKVQSVFSNYTSILAFDGSGFVERDKHHFHVVKFKETASRGPKIYNADLCAANNIGARYFIRNILDGLPQEKKDSMVLELKSLKDPIYTTLNSLRQLNRYLKEH